MQKKNAPIGVLDSRCWRAQRSEVSEGSLVPMKTLFMWVTPARTPYGSRSEVEVRTFVGEMLDFLTAEGVKLVVIACNTLTVLGTETLKGNPRIRPCRHVQGRAPCLRGKPQ